jgi:uncharacterized membrane protein YhfC
MAVSVIVTWVLALLVMFLFPVLLGIWFCRRYQVRWTVLLFGAAIFFVFQIVIRVPAVTLLGPVVAPHLRGSKVLLALYLAALAFSAGLFESVGRWVGYKWLFRSRLTYDWRHGVAYGIGHGGIESIVLVGLSSALSLVQGIVLTRMDTVQLQAIIPEAALAQTLAARELLLNVTWIDPLWAGWERMMTMPFHVAMSLIVLQVFTQGQIRWLWVAVLIHGLVDFGVLMGGQFLGFPIWAIELCLAVCAAAALWLILKLRPSETPLTVEA